MLGKIRDGLLVIMGRMGTQVSGLVITPFAARYLTHVEFGVWAIILVINGFGSLLTDAGLPLYVLKEQDWSKERRGTVIWFSAALGALITGIVFLATDFLAKIFGIGGYGYLLMITAGTFIPISVGAIYVAEIKKALNFKLAAFIEALTAFSNLGIGVALLVMNEGVRGMALAFLFSSFIPFIIGGVKLGVPVPFVSLKLLREALKYTWGLLGFNIINYFARRLDQVIIVRRLGANALAPYAIAYRLMMLPINQLNRVVITVITPHLALEQSDTIKVRDGLLKATQLIGIIATPAMTVFWLNREFLVRIYLGEGWGQVADIMGIFALVGLLQSLVNPIGVAFQLTSRNKELFYIGLLNTAVVIVSLFIGLRWGVIGACWSYGVANVLMLFPTVGCGYRGLNASFFWWAKRIWFYFLIPFFSYLIMLVVSISNPWVNLLFAIGCSLLLTAFVALLFLKEDSMRVLYFIAPRLCRMCGAHQN